MSGRRSEKWVSGPPRSAPVFRGSRLPAPPCIMPMADLAMTGRILCSRPSTSRCFQYFIRSSVNGTGATHAWTSTTWTGKPGCLQRTGQNIAAGQVEPGVVPVAGKDVVTHRALTQRESHVRAAVSRAWTSPSWAKTAMIWPPPVTTVHPLTFQFRHLPSVDEALYVGSHQVASVRVVISFALAFRPGISTPARTSPTTWYRSKGGTK